MALPEQFLSELISRSDISEIVSDYVNIKKHGRNMVGLCPFHNEKTPSFNVYTQNNSFYCFGCGVGGNIINFVMRIENLDYIDAVKFLAQRTGMNMPENSYDDSAALLRKRIFEANRQAARFYYTSLYSKEGSQALEYLRNRGLTEKTIRYFGLGFAPNNPFVLSNHLRSIGFKNSEIVAANLAFNSKRGDSTFDRFRNRVMFPIIDLHSNVIAFGGRIMTDEKPKYLNTSDTLVFKKSTNLFSLNNAKNTGDRKLILCEGYMDVIAVNQAGFKNAVATLGTALTVEQSQLMKRYADEVIICYDSDEAGQKATNRAIEILRATGIVIKVITLPNAKDPDEFIKSKGEHGAAAFKNIIENSGNDVEYRLQKLKINFNINTAEGKVQFLKEAVKILCALDNAIEQDVYASKLSEELGVQKTAIVQQIKKQSRRKYSDLNKKEFRKIQDRLSGRDDKVNSQHYIVPRGTKAEESILAYLINNPDSASYIEDKLPAKNFLTEFNRRLYSYFLDRIKQGLEPANNIAADFSSNEASKIAQINASFNNEATTAQALNEYINVVIQEKLKLTEEDIKHASNDEILDFLDRIKKNHK